jgi:hypothetical protein
MTLEASMLSLRRWFGDSKRIRSVNMSLRGPGLGRIVKDELAFALARDGA